MRPHAADVTVLICTHNRRALLARVIESLNACDIPEASIAIFVVANACTDDTHAWLDGYMHDAHGLPLAWIAEPVPGKSNALNTAQPLLESPLIAFVDDDHRVDTGYLVEVVNAARQWPEAGLLCGRILPDWDGKEPSWVHDTGPFRIYPLPVPRYDLGTTPERIDARGTIPGGGNLVARLAVIRQTGGFLTDLGPIGHDLGGAEDLEWIRRAMQGGALLQYCPGIVQYHYVDTERLTLSYLLRKGYQRSKSVMQFRKPDRRVPLFMWRKACEYLASTVFTLQPARRRFYLVRLASTIGEIVGVREQIRRRHAHLDLPRPVGRRRLWALATTSAVALSAPLLIAPAFAGRALNLGATLGAAVMLLLALKSARDFSQTGPRLRGEVLSRYRLYTVFSLLRLGSAVFLLSVLLAVPGIMVALLEAGLARDGVGVALLGGLASLGGAVTSAGMWALGDNPGLIITSWAYRTAPLHWLSRRVGPHALRWLARLGALAVMGIPAACALLAFAADQRAEGLALLSYMAGLLALYVFASAGFESPAPRHRARREGPLNILMIGCDTLRADRIGACREGRSLTPAIDQLARGATLFTACYVPCARTAPSLISLLTGTWPHVHGIRDNYVPDHQFQLDMPSLPQLLARAGYRSAAISDWCGADLGKFDFGFDLPDVPGDQWNLKYLIRQGPKDVRLLLSLFMHNRIGRLLLPEIYYLGGVPQTDQLSARARARLDQFAQSGHPFLLNVFFSNTHPPFSTEYPYYGMFSDPDYRGESRFAMAKLTEPFEIIRRQGEPREEFDLDQILALYDGGVVQFDREVGRMLAHLERTGLADSTLVLLYSDHGMEFFEHGTWGQGNSAVGDFSARIPLLIRDPRDGAGRRVDQVVRSIDVLPTLLDLVGLEPVRCDGVSLRPAMADDGIDLGLSACNETGIWITRVPGQPPNHLAYPDLFELLDIPDDSTGTMAVKSAYAERVVIAKDRMIRKGRWKLVFQPLETGIRLTLYDLADDPACVRDLAAERPEVVAELWPDLAAWIRADPICAQLPDGLPGQAH